MAARFCKLRSFPFLPVFYRFLPGSVNPILFPFSTGPQAVTVPRVISVRIKAFALALLAAWVNWASPVQADPLAGDLAGFRQGVNFGNYLEVPPDAGWSVKHDAEDVLQVKKEGFDHIRLPVGWHNYAGPSPEFKLDAKIFDKVDHIVTNALEQGLGVIVNIHHFDAFTTEPEKETKQFLAIWRQLAEHYKDFSEKLVFELLNEPKDAATTEVMNGIYGKAIATIRKTNPTRIIFIGPGKWNSLDEVEKLRLPEEDRNLVVTVHCYDPFLFTHQGASWTMPATATTGIQYPGPPEKPIEPDPRVQEQWNRKWIENYNRLPPEENPSSDKAYRQRMEKVAKWARDHQRPIHLGEFGAVIHADPQSRLRYYKEKRRVAEELGFGWAIWDWKANFRYWKDGEAVDGMQQALFGK